MPFIIPHSYIIHWTCRLSGWYYDLGLIKGMIWKMPCNNIYISFDIEIVILQSVDYWVVHFIVGHCLFNTIGLCSFPCIFQKVFLSILGSQISEISVDIKFIQQEILCRFIPYPSITPGITQYLTDLHNSHWQHMIRRHY
jgi:hypothetical protein